MKWKLISILLFITYVCLAHQGQAIAVVYQLFFIVLYLVIGIVLILINFILFEMYKSRSRLSVSLYSYVSILLCIYSSYKFLVLTKSTNSYMYLIIPLIMIAINIYLLVTYNTRSKQ